MKFNIKVLLILITVLTIASIPVFAEGNEVPSTNETAVVDVSMIGSGVIQVTPDLDVITLKILVVILSITLVIAVMKLVCEFLLNFRNQSNPHEIQQPALILATQTIETPAIKL